MLRGADNKRGAVCCDYHAKYTNTRRRENSKFLTLSGWHTLLLLCYKDLNNERCPLRIIAVFNKAVYFCFHHSATRNFKY